MKSLKMLVCGLLLAVGCSISFAGTVDDAIKLKNSGVKDEVMVAWAEKTDSTVLTSTDIVALMNAKVPDRVILTLIRKGILVKNQDPVVVQQPVVVSQPQVVVDDPVYYSTPYVYSYGYPSYYSAGRGYYHPSLSFGFNFGGGHSWGGGGHSWGGHGGRR